MIIGLHHAGLTVKNLEKAIEFYGDVLGLELFALHEASGEELSKRLGVENASIKVAFFKAGQDLIQLIEFVSPKSGSESLGLSSLGTGHPSFLVDSIEKTYEELRKKGVKFNAPPHTIQYGGMKDCKYCFAKDAEDFTFEIMEPKR